MLVGENTLDQIAPESNEEPTSVEVDEPVSIPTPGSEEEPDGSGEDDASLSADEIEEIEEIERNGKKYKVHKDLKSELLMQADYTRKTQELAAERKALEAQSSQHAQLSQERMQALGEIALAERQIAALEQGDWSTPAADDYIGQVEYNTRRTQLQEWKEYRAQVAQGVMQSDQQRALVMQQETAKQIEEAERQVRADIPNWETEKRAIFEYATSELGFKPEDLSGVRDPRIAKTLHLAKIGAQLMKAAAAKKAPAQVPDVKPLATVSARSGGAGVRKSLSAMSMEEYAAARKSGRAA